MQSTVHFNRHYEQFSYNMLYHTFTEYKLYTHTHHDVNFIIDPIATYAREVAINESGMEVANQHQ